MIDSREVARLLGIGRTKTFQLIASGELPSVRLGRCVRVSSDALRRWIDVHMDRDRDPAAL
ncbi:MAG TPA: helix-turn-helix domain-containing protein [Candidatus Dormibacteraeota bacterium]|nr:helix-turn-helix domain-containing protein [Candidatus Dormibacteraeota bacterium]